MYKGTTERRLAIALGLVGVVLSQAGPVAAGPLPLPPLEGSYGYVWGG